MTFLNPSAAFLFWTIPLLAIVFFFAEKRKKREVHRFSGNARIVLGRKSTRAAILILISAACMVFAVMRPVMNRKTVLVERQGRDVVFVIDVSRSMLAQDLKPNRLEQAKLSIIDSLSAFKGDRIALVAFAGSSVVKCPLTFDYNFFGFALMNLQPESVARGGTLIGDAIRKALNEVFLEESQGYRDLILITDGEDQDSFPVEAAGQAGKAGVRILAIGLGDESTGERVPVVSESGEREYLTYNGEEVWTRLDAETLREIASATPGGAYLNVRTGTFDFAEIYSVYIASAEKERVGEEKIEEWDEAYGLFLFPALVLLGLGSIPSRRRNPDEVR